MVSDEQIRMVAGEAIVPVPVVNAVVCRLCRRGDPFACSDVMAAVMEITHPALAGWRARRV